MKPLGGAVQRVLRALGLEDDLARADAVEAWTEVASGIIGADAVRTRALRVEGGTLVVAVPTAQWAAEIRLRERALVAALRARVPAGGVRRIRAVPGERETAKRSAPRNAGAGAPGADRRDGVGEVERDQQGGFARPKQ